MFSTGTGSWLLAQMTVWYGTYFLSCSCPWCRYRTVNRPLETSESTMENFHPSFYSLIQDCLIYSTLSNHVGPLIPLFKRFYNICILLLLLGLGSSLSYPLVNLL
jgi:hypothetical protein